MNTTVWRYTKLQTVLKTLSGEEAMYLSLNKLFTYLLIGLTLLINSAQLAAAEAAEVDTEVRNYLGENVAIEFKILTATGRVSWERVGEVNKKSARIFRRVTIGSVLRARTISGNQVLSQYTIKQPKSGGLYIVSIQGKKE